MNERTLHAIEYDKITGILAGYAVTPMGTELCRDVLPDTDYARVVAALEETASAVSYIVKGGYPPLFESRDVRPSVSRLDKGAIMGAADLLAIAQLLRMAQQMVSYAASARDSRIMEGEGPENDPVGALVSTLFTDRRLETSISGAIISENEFSDDASPELYSIRRSISNLQNGIRDKLNELIRSSKYSKYLQDSLISVRGDRYVVPVKAEYRNEIPGIVHDTSGSGSTLFVEPMAVVEADNKIRELRVKEQLEIERILASLTAMAYGDLAGLRQDVAVLGQLDFAFAKAKFSLDYECASPIMNDKGIIDIKKARHPLIPRERVVPIDCRLGEDFNVLVVTGPNTGGKTVSLKTVGLLQAMVQAGMQIPASSLSRMSVFDDIFADIGDEQSIEQNLSTFSAHMTNIVDILNSIEGRSLVLLDELGSGTDPTEGAGLAMAILEYLNNAGVFCMATTHYSELKVFASTTPGVENACCEFDVQTLQSMYKLLIGIPGKSNAFAISSRLGLWPFLIDRARQMVTQDELKFEDMLVNIEQSRQEAEQDRQEAAETLRESQRRKEALEREIAALQKKRDTIISDARTDAKRIVSRAKDEMSDILDEARKLRGEYTRNDFGRAAEDIRSRAREQENLASKDDSQPETVSGEPPDPSSLKTGQQVFLATLGTPVTVETLPGRGGSLQVRSGAVKMTVKVSDLRTMTDSKPKASKPPERRYSRPTASSDRQMKAATIDPRLDIRGEMVADGLEKLDKFLDDALLAGLSTVTIVHGKGTGALRAGVQQYLRSHPRVRSFRLGQAGEGDAGVTVAELR